MPRDFSFDDEALNADPSPGYETADGDVVGKPEQEPETSTPASPVKFAAPINEFDWGVAKNTGSSEFFKPQIAQAQAEEAQRAQEDRQKRRQEAKVAAEAGRAGKKVKNSLLENRFRQQGVKFFTDANGDINPETNDDGTYRFHPKEDITYDDNGIAVSVKRDETGNVTATDADANAPIGAGKSPKDQGIYKQNKNRGWDWLGNAEDLIGSQDEAVAGAAQKKMDENNKALAQSAGQALSEKHAAVMEEKAAVQSEATKLGAQIQDKRATLSAIENDPDFNQKTGGFLGIGSSLTQRAQDLQAQAARLKAEIDPLDKEFAAKQARLSDKKGEEGDLNLAEKAAADEMKIFTAETKYRNYQDVLDKRTSFLKRTGKTDEEIAADPVVKSVQAKAEEIGIDVQGMKKARDEQKSADDAIVNEGKKSVAGGRASIDELKQNRDEIESASSQLSQDFEKFKTDIESGKVSPEQANATRDELMARRGELLKKQGMLSQKADDLAGAFDKGATGNAKVDSILFDELPADPRVKLVGKLLNEAGKLAGSGKMADAGKRRELADKAINQMSDSGVDVTALQEAVKKPKAYEMGSQGFQFKSGLNVPFEEAVSQAVLFGDMTQAQGRQTIVNARADLAKSREKLIAGVMKDQGLSKKEDAEKYLQGMNDDEFRRLQNRMNLADYGKNSWLGAVPAAMGGNLIRSTVKATYGLESSINSFGQLLTSMTANAAGMYAGKNLENNSIDKNLQANIDFWDRKSAEIPVEASSLKDIKTIGDAWNFTQYAAGTLLPNIVFSIGTGGMAGAGAKGVMASRGMIASVEAAETATTTARTAGNIAKATELAAGAEKTRKAIEFISKASEYGGAFAGSLPLEAGSIYADIKKETGQSMPWTALGFGAVASVLDAYTPGKFLGKLRGQATKAVSKEGFLQAVKEIGMASFKDRLGEGVTEGLQTVIEKFAVAYAKDNWSETLSPENIQEALDSAAVGFLGIPGISEHAAHGERKESMHEQAKAKADYAAMKPMLDISSDFAYRLPDTGKLKAALDGLKPTADQIALGAKNPVETVKNLQSADSKISELNKQISEAEAKGDQVSVNRLSWELAQTQEGRGKLVQDAAATAAAVVADREIAGLPDYQPQIDQITGQVVPGTEGHPDTYRQFPRALIRISNGVSTAMLTSGESAALEVMGRKLGMPPLRMEKGVAIITDRAAQWLKDNSPASGQFIASTEAQMLEKLNLGGDSNGQSESQGQKEKGLLNPSDPSSNKNEAGSGFDVTVDVNGEEKTVNVSDAKTETEAKRIVAENPKQFGLPEKAGSIRVVAAEKIEKSETSQKVPHGTSEVLKKAVSDAPANLRDSAGKAASIISKVSGGLEKVFAKVIFASNKDSKNTFSVDGNGNLTVNLASWEQDQKRSNLEKWARAAIVEEVIHKAAMSSISNSEAIDLWKKLPESIKQKVVTAYFRNRINKTGKLLDNVDAPVQEGDSPEGHAWRMGHEFLRMVVQGDIMNELTETVDVNPGLMQQIRDILNQILGYLKAAEADNAMVKEAADKVRAKLAEMDAFEKSTLTNRTPTRINTDASNSKGSRAGPESGQSQLPGEPSGSGVSAQDQEGLGQKIPGGGTTAIPLEGKPDSGNGTDGVDKLYALAQRRFDGVFRGLGSRGRSYTDTNVPIEFQWAVVESDALTVSNRNNGTVNPEYPGELQPRDRTAPGMVAQISDIAKNTNIDRLSDSAAVNDGAPFIGPDGVVESGNGRVMGISLAYQEKLKNVEAYRQNMIKNAAKWGLNPTEIEKMKNPVLVRIRTTDVNRRMFVEGANVGNVAPMRESEIANTDAAKLAREPALYGFITISDNGTIDPNKNDAFIQRFMKLIPQNERPALVGVDSKINQSGLRRIRNALFAAAYGGNVSLLQRMSESIDDSVKNITAALTTAAAGLASQNSAIESGDLFDASIAPDVAKAAAKLIALRESGEKVSDYLNQTEFFADVTPLQKDILSFMDANIRAPRRIVQALAGYTHALEKAGSPKQGSLLGETPAPDKAALWKQAKNWEPDATLFSSEQSDMFGIQTSDNATNKSGNLFDLLTPAQIARKKTHHGLFDGTLNSGERSEWTIPVDGKGLSDYPDTHEGHRRNIRRAIESEKDDSGGSDGASPSNGNNTASPGSLVSKGLTQELDFRHFDSSIKSANAKDIGRNEHQVYWDKKTYRVFKLTKEGEYGASKSLADYLKRIETNNDILQDDLRLEGVFKNPETGKYRILISQPHINGRPATRSEISDYFKAKGFKPYSDRAYWSESREILYSDADESNVIFSEDGKIYPIDVIPEWPSSGRAEMIQNIVDARDSMSLQSGEKVDTNEEQTYLNNSEKPSSTKANAQASSGSRVRPSSSATGEGRQERPDSGDSSGQVGNSSITFPSSDIVRDEAIKSANLQGVVKSLENKYHQYNASIKYANETKAYADSIRQSDPETAKAWDDVSEEAKITSDLWLKSWNFDADSYLTAMGLESSSDGQKKINLIYEHANGSTGKNPVYIAGESFVVADESNGFVTKIARKNNILNVSDVRVGSDGNIVVDTDNNIDGEMKQNMSRILPGMAPVEFKGTDTHGNYILRQPFLKQDAGLEEIDQWAKENGYIPVPDSTDIGFGSVNKESKTYIGRGKDGNFYVLTDVKPGNIRIGNDGIPLATDILAKQITVHEANYFTNGKSLNSSEMDEVNGPDEAIELIEAFDIEDPATWPTDMQDTVAFDKESPANWNFPVVKTETPDELKARKETYSDLYQKQISSYTEKGDVANAERLRKSFENMAPLTFNEAEVLSEFIDSFDEDDSDTWGSQNEIDEDNFEAEKAAAQERFAVAEKRFEELAVEAKSAWENMQKQAQTRVDGLRAQLVKMGYKEVDGSWEAPTLLYSGESVTPGQDAKYLEAVKSGNLVVAKSIVDAAAKAAGYTIEAYHGTSRGDRIGNRFKKSRATSGPMQYFTSDPNIAKNYSEGKQDTSLEMPDDYRDWFKIKNKITGKKESNLRNAWYYLSPEQKKTVIERLYTTGYQNYEEADGPIVPNSQSIMGRDTIDYELRKAQGNGLEAAKEIWLNSGSLFGREPEFLDVLKALGIEGARLDDPNAKYPKVYNTFLRIQNPFVTDKITPEQIETLQKVANRQRKPPAKYGADAWDKRMRDPQEWMTQLREDFSKKKNSMVWTSIPDWVSKTLEGMGYDGIHDTGGKLGGQGHDVYIPFLPTQIKSSDPVTYDNAGRPIPVSKRFNQTTDNILYSGERSFDFDNTLGLPLFDFTNPGNPISAIGEAAQQIIEDSDATKAKLVKDNIGLAVKIARGYANIPGVDMADLEQEAKKGLIIAAQKFDASKGSKFSSYAGVVIGNRLKEIFNSEVYRSSFTGPSLDAPVGDDSASSLSDLIGSEDTTVSNMMSREEAKILQEEIAKLPERPKAILMGIMSQRSLEDIGNDYGIGKQAVSKTALNTYKFLKKRLEQRGITRHLNSGESIEDGQNAKGEYDQNSENNTQSQSRDSSGSFKSAKSVVGANGFTDRPELGHAYESEFYRQRENFQKWARSSNHTLEKLTSPLKFEGAEHKVFHREGDSRVFKVTRSKPEMGFRRYGLIPELYGNKIQIINATPSDYLTRWPLHNAVFGDDVRLEGGINMDGEFEAVISQPFIVGESPDIQEIQDYLEQLGFYPIESPMDGYYYNPQSKLIIGDAFERNFVKSNDGKVFAIDIPIAKASQKAVEYLNNSGNAGVLYSSPIVGERLGTVGEDFSVDPEPMQFENASFPNHILINKAKLIFAQFPKELTTGDGTIVSLKEPDWEFDKNGKRTQKTVLGRILHLITAGDRLTVDTTKFKSMKNTLTTLKDPAIRVLDPETGNHVYIKRYSNGMKHFVVVSPNGAVQSQKPFNGKMVTQFPEVGKEGRKADFVIEWVREKRQGLLQNAPKVTSTDSTVSGPRQSTFQGDNIQDGEDVNREPLYSSASSPEDAKLNELKNLLSQLRLNEANFQGALAKAQTETPGQKTQGRPDLANPGQTEEARTVVNAVDEARKYDLERQEMSDWQDQAKKRIETDYTGVKTRLIESALRGEGIVDPVEVKAAQMIVAKEIQEAIQSKDQAKMRDVALLVNAYRETGTETARSLAARRDTFKRPDERNREFLAKAVFTPSPEVRKRAEKMVGKEKQQFLADASNERLQKIEAELKKMGVSLEDIFAGEVGLKLKGIKILDNILKAMPAKDSDIFRMLQQGKGWHDIQIIKGVNKQAIDAVFASVKSKLKTQILSKIQLGGARESDFDMAGIEKLMSSALGTSESMSLADAEAEFEKIWAKIVPPPKRNGYKLKVKKAGSNEKAKPIEKGQTPSMQDDWYYDKFDLKDPSAVAQVGRVMQAMDGNAADMVYEYWINSILSGPQTHAVNIAGNAISAALDMTLQRGTEAMLNGALSTVGLGDEKSAQFGEFKYLIRGLIPNIAKAWRNTQRAFDVEQGLFESEAMGGAQIDLAGYEKFTGHRAAIGGTKGRVVRIPGRALVAMDEFFKTLLGNMQVGAEAYRIAKSEGLSGNKLEKRISGLVNESGSEAWAAAINVAKRLTFQEEIDPDSFAGRSTKAAKTFANTLPGVRYFIPFIHTVMNIFRAGIRKSPLGSVSFISHFARHGLYKISDGKIMGSKEYARPEMIRHAAEQVLAFMVTALLAGAAEGDDDDEDKQFLITGSRSRGMGGQALNALDKRTGQPAFTIRMGNTQFNYGRYEPVATILGVTVDTIRTAKTLDKKDAMDVFGDVAKTIVDNVTSKTFAQGLGYATDVVKDPRSAADWLSSFAASWIPNVIRQPVRQVDDKVRETSVSSDGKNLPARFVEKTLKQVVPQMAQPKVDPYGKDIEKKGTTLSRLIVPGELGNVDPINRTDRMLLNWNQAHPDEPWAPASLKRDVTLDDKTKYRMTDTEYHEFNKLRGEIANTVLGRLNLNVANPSKEDIEKVKKAFEFATHEAKRRIFKGQKVDKS